MGTPNYMSPEQATGMVEDIDQRADQWALACIAWEMLLGRGPFVADDVSAILYQIINMEPHPLTPRVPGLPPAVEPVLRRALRKRLEGRFPSMREFSRELEAAASGRLADATPAPVPVPAAPGAGGTVLYGATPVTPAPVRPPAGGVPRAARKPDADVSQAEDNSIHVPLRNRIKPIYAIIVAAGLALLLGAYLLIGARRADVRPSSAPATAPKPMPPPATIAKPALGPTVTPLLAPEPPPPTVAAPQPAPLPPTRGEDAKAPVARRPQPALAPVVTPVSAAKSPAAESFDVDKFLREHDQRKTESIDSKRRQDPWADDSDVSTGTKQNKKPVAPSAAKPPATRKPPHANPPLFEEL
jgi:serine/threonine-protein kinase